MALNQIDKSIQTLKYHFFINKINEKRLINQKSGIFSPYSGN